MRRKRARLRVCYSKSDLQGAVAAVEVVQTGRENELFVCASQRLRGEEKEKTGRKTRDPESLAFSLTS